MHAFTTLVGAGAFVILAAAGTLTEMATTTVTVVSYSQGYPSTLCSTTVTVVETATPFVPVGTNSVPVVSSVQSTAPGSSTTIEIATQGSSTTIELTITGTPTSTLESSISVPAVSSGLASTPTAFSTSYPAGGLSTSGVVVTGTSTILLTTSKPSSAPITSTTSAAPSQQTSANAAAQVVIPVFILALLALSASFLL